MPSCVLTLTLGPVPVHADTPLLFTKMNMQGLELEISDDDEYFENKPLLGGDSNGYGSYTSSARAERWPLAKECAPASACKGLVGYTACIFLAAGIVATSALWPSHNGRFTLGLVSRNGDVVDSRIGEGSEKVAAGGSTSPPLFEPYSTNSILGSVYTSSSGSELPVQRSTTSYTTSYDSTAATTATTASSSTSTHSPSHAPSAQPSSAPSESPTHVPTTLTPTLAPTAGSSTSAFLLYGAIGAGVVLSLGLGVLLAFCGSCDGSSGNKNKTSTAASSSSSSSSSSPSSPSAQNRFSVPQASPPPSRSAPDSMRRSAPKPEAQAPQPKLDSAPPLRSTQVREWASGYQHAVIFLT